MNNSADIYNKNSCSDNLVQGESPRDDGILARHQRILISNNTKELKRLYAENAKLRKENSKLKKSNNIETAIQIAAAPKFEEARDKVKRNCGIILVSWGKVEASLKHLLNNFNKRNEYKDLTSKIPRNLASIISVLDECISIYPEREPKFRDLTTTLEKLKKWQELRNFAAHNDAKIYLSQFNDAVYLFEDIATGKKKYCDFNEILACVSDIQAIESKIEKQINKIIALL